MAQTLRITVLKGEQLVAKTKGSSDPYVELTLFDENLAKVGKPLCTRVIKSNLNPNWNQELVFQLNKPPKESFSLKVCVWDKHTFRTDKFMGQCSIQFNAELINSTDVIEQWFPLSPRKVQEAVSGKINLKIQYGTLKEKPKAVSLQEMKEEQKKEPKPPKEGELPVGAKESLDELRKSGLKFHIIKENVTDEYDSIRTGPATTSMKQIGNSAITIQRGLELTQNGNYSLEPARGDVVVTAGKWFYEVRIQCYQQLQIGWATEDYNPRVNQNGDAWCFDGNSSQKIRKGNGTVYGQRCNSNDVLGVALDLDERILRFYKNGQSMGDAFGKGEFSKNLKLVPFCNMSSRSKCTFNFGKDPFVYPIKGFNPLHCFLSEKEVVELAKLFDHYKTLSNDDEEIPKEEWTDSIHDAGIDELIKDLEIKDQDTGFLVLSWKLSCENAFEITRDEWMNNLTIHACYRTKDIISKIVEWKKDIQREDMFKTFYNWVFKYMRGDKKKLETEQCKTLWDLLLKPRNWPMYKDWNEYLEDKKSSLTSISEDCWKMMIEFSTSCSKNVDNYDDKKAWPVEIDGFVDWMNGAGGDDSDDDDL